MERFHIVRDNLIFGLVLALELALIVAVLWGVIAFESATSRRADSRETRTVIDSARSALLDAESAQRGYLLSSDAAFLDSFRDARRRLGDGLALLAERVAEEPPQSASLAALQPLIDQRIGEMEQSIEGTGGSDSPIDGEDLELMTAILSQFEVIRAVESARLNDAIGDSDRIGRFLGATAVIFSSATLGVVGWLFFVLRRRHQAERMHAVAAAKDEFVGFISHELRTPIAMIAGNAWVVENADTAEERQRGTQEIEAAAERLQDIVEILRTLSAVEAGGEIEVEPILLHRIVERTIRSHRERYPESQVEVRGAPDLPPANGNRVAVEQVLLNLLSNAEKYGNQQGPIAISLAQAGRQVAVTVENPGEITDSARFANVFEPFFRGGAAQPATPGIGLGLTVCHRLITAQHGRVSARPRPTGGAEFTFTLPVVEEDGADGA